MNTIDQPRGAVQAKPTAFALPVAPGIATSVRWHNDTPAAGLSVTAASVGMGIAIKGAATSDGVLLVAINDRTVRLEVAAGETAAAVARALDATVRAGWPALAAPPSHASENVQIVHICRRGDIVATALAPETPLVFPEETGFGNMGAAAAEQYLRGRFPVEKATVASVVEVFRVLAEMDESIVHPGVLRFLADALPRAIADALKDESYGAASVARLRRKVESELGMAEPEPTEDEAKALRAPFVG